MTALAPYAAVMTAVIAAYLAFRHQQRLKAFELFYGRRTEVIRDIEAELSRVHTDLETCQPDSRMRVADYHFRYFNRGMVLHQKVAGANFGEMTTLMGSTYYALLMEPLSQPESFDLSDWLERMANTLAALYGITHNALSYEMEMLTLPWHRKVQARFRRAQRVRKMKRGNRQRSGKLPDPTAPNQPTAPGG